MLHTLRFSLKNAVYFIMLPFLVPVLLEGNIKIDLLEVGRGRGDWMELAQDRDRLRELVGTARNFRVP
jgi:hypothetical protein